MTLPAQVTIVGSSPASLEARANVLQQFWRVDAVSLDLGQLLNFPTDLLVVSASILGPQRQAIVEAARARDPRLLIVRMDSFDSGPMSGADATVDEGRGPGALVSAIYELLTERGLGSRGWPKLYEAGAWVQ